MIVFSRLVFLPNLMEFNLLGQRSIFALLNKDPEGSCRLHSDPVPEALKSVCPIVCNI